MITSSVVLLTVICLVVIVLLALIALYLKRNKNPLDSTELVNEQVYVGNLPYRVTEDDLLDYFSNFGKTQSVRIIRNYKTGRSKGYAFVTYATSNEANSALVAHGKELFGRTMVVRIAKPRQI